MENAPIQFKSLIYHRKDLKLHYVRLTKEIMEMLSGKFERGKYNQRVWIEINKKIKWQGGIVSLGEGEGYITLSAARMKKINVHFGEEVNVSLLPDNSEFGMEMAQEFEAVLNSDEELKTRFSSLTKSLQRYMLYYVLQVKSSEKRMERSIKILNNLREIPSGQEDFRRILGKE